MLKDNLIRLGAAVARELREAETRRQKRLFDSFAHGQTEVLEMILNRVPLTVILERIIERVEILSPGDMACSILLADAEGTHLNFGAGPSLPPEFTLAMKEIPILPGVGSCGTAAALGKNVVMEDIQPIPTGQVPVNWSSEAGFTRVGQFPFLHRTGGCLARSADITGRSALLRMRKFGGWNPRASR